MTLNVVRGSDPASDLTISNGFNNSGSLTKTGNGICTLACANFYGGATTISAGTLVVGNGGTTGSLGTSSAIADNATLAFHRSDSIFQGTQFSGSAITGTGGLVQLGPGMLTLNAANSYSGGTTIAGGTLGAATVAAGASNLGNAATAIVLGGASAQGTLLYTGSSATFAPGLAINAGGGKLSVVTAGQTMTLGGVTGSGPLAFGGAGNTTLQTPLPSGITTLNKTDGGTLVLAGNDAYTGVTTINGGAVYFNGPNATPSITLADGATLGGSGSAPSATASVANSGILDFSQNTGSTFALTSLQFQGTASVNVGNLTSYESAGVPSAPVLNVTGSNGLSAGGALGSVTFYLSGPAPSGSGAIQLIQYNGSAVQGTGSAAFAAPVVSGLTGLGTRATFQLAFPAGYVDLNYFVDHPVWTGRLMESGTPARRARRKTGSWRPTRLPTRTSRSAMRLSSTTWPAPIRWSASAGRGTSAPPRSPSATSRRATPSPARTASSAEQIC